MFPFCAVSNPATLLVTIMKGASLQMRFDYLKEFLMLASVRNYGVAADRLFISQPVLSRHIISLEEFIGVKLFVRGSVPIALTPAGGYFQEKCEKIVRMIDETRQEIRFMNQGYTANLNIGVPYYSNGSYIGPFLGLFHREYPNVIVSLHAYSPDECIRNLFCENLDGIILVHMNYPNADQLVFKDLYKERLTILVNEHHPFAERGEVCFDDLKGETFLSIDSVYRKTFDAFFSGKCSEHGFQPQLSEKKYTQLETALLELQQAPDNVIYSAKDVSDLQFPNIRSIDILDPDAFRYVSLICIKNNEVPALNLFKDCFLNHVGEFGWG